MSASLPSTPAPAPQGAETGTSRPPQRPTVFFCCAVADRDHRDTLKRHLAGMFRERFVAWSEDDVLAGAEHEAEIGRALDRATVIVLLVSADLLASTRHRDTEVRRALGRHARGEALVIPVILRACDWARAPFAGLQALPRESGAPPRQVPVLSAPDLDEAFAEVAIEIRKAAEAFTPAASAPFLPAGPARSSKTLALGTAAVALVIVGGVMLSRFFIDTPDSGAQAQTASAPSAASGAAPASTDSPSASDQPTSTSSMGSTAPPPSTPRPPISAAPSSSTSPSTDSNGAAPPVVTGGSAACKGTVCTLRARGGRVTASRFCLSAPASADDLEDLKPTCSGKQSTRGEDFPCIRADQAASIPLKGSVTWTACP